jgi:hypothetical protein
MQQLTDDIFQFLRDSGIEAAHRTVDGVNILTVSCNDAERIILPVGIKAATPAEAQDCAEAIQEFISRKSGPYPLIIPEDRWRRQTEMMKGRLLAHLEVFTPVYARNCEIRRIDKPTAAEFLNRTHTYGDAACKYRYGIFLKRNTGHVAKEGRCGIPAGTLIAAGTFSNARKWIKNGKEIRSYEWTRFASLPEVRISGGMGKILKAFIEEVHPDDIMSYADLEWSEGTVYEQLGFILEGRKDPVMFEIDTEWERHPVKNVIHTPTSGNLFFCNFGSNKYRLKLTEYE